MAALQHILDALGDPTRRAVFERLRRGPRAVGQLARVFPVSRPAISQHLRVLKDAGLVRDERVGTRRFYRVDPVGLAELRAYAESFWTEALGRFKEMAERDQAPPAAARPSRSRRRKP
ncbi:MAG TPA: metalloregulator ArsR/SmtB family transcription factor [bacterium]|nr:metalloregulator ArsR/SmtB family transcription factor [bacterium]